MAAKPAVNDTDWGTTLNAFLDVSHEADGTLKDSAVDEPCKAWVRFDGTDYTDVGGEDRCSIKANKNVAKVVRTSLGVYAVHFSEDIEDANYAITGSARGPNANTPATALSPARGVEPTASVATIATAEPGGVNSLGRLSDSDLVSVVIFR